MAKLTDRQKENIIAKWKTGQYSKRELARKYKIAETSVRRVVAGVAPENAEIVEQAVQVEKQKSRISGADRQAIEVVVREKTKHEMMIEKIQDNILTGTLVNTKNTVKALKKRGKDMDVSEKIGHQKVLKDSNDIIKPSVTAIQVNTSTQVSVESTDALLEALKKKGLPH